MRKVIFFAYFGWVSCGGDSGESDRTELVEATENINEQFATWLTAKTVEVEEKNNAFAIIRNCKIIDVK